jgi:hypothetical protein
MRPALIAFVAVVAVLIAGAQSGSGQESFFNDRYCARGGHDNLLDCGYNTWQQCISTARGLARYCIVNPFWHGHREQPTTQGRSRLHH